MKALSGKKMNCREAYLQTKETGLPLREAAANNPCLHTELQSSTNLQASMSQLLACLLLQPVFQRSWCPMVSYLQEKIKEGRLMRRVTSFPHKCPVKIRWCVRAGRLCSSQERWLVSSTSELFECFRKKPTQNNPLLTILALSNPEEMGFHTTTLLFPHSCT